MKEVETGKLKVADVFQGEVVLEMLHEEKYLGEILSEDGKNTKNVMSRKNKGLGLVTKISAMLLEAMLGKEHFETVILIRNAILVSSFIFKCKAWYGLKKKEIDMVEKVAEKILRKFIKNSKIFDVFKFRGSAHKISHSSKKTWISQIHFGSK